MPTISSRKAFARFVNLLLDTHILVWMATDPERIPPKLLAAIADAEIRYVSIVTAMEIQLKNMRHPDTFSFQCRSRNGYGEILLHSNAVNVPRCAYAAADGLYS